jgi:signal transduction histidine kinase
LYSLGRPQQIELEGRMVSAQAAAITSLSSQRVGTVVVLRDITEEVRRERARDVVLKRMAQEVQQPLADSAREQSRDAAYPTTAFAREISRHAIALQKLIVEMREMTSDLDSRPQAQHPLLLDTLIWSIANEWRQIAQAANLSLRVMIERKGLYVLGDERRLRWAIGNVMDNAIKYTPPGGALTLEIRGELNGLAQLRVRDNGVGITAEDLPHIFTRFYRGDPVTAAGRAIRVPGMGQGLTFARQIIEAQGGKIQVKSSPGVGTAVYFALPLTSSVSLELPTPELPRLLLDDMEGETVRLGDEKI